MGDNEKKIVVFGGKKIRRKVYLGEWYFSVVDVVRVLTDSKNPRKYWNKLIQRLREEGSELSAKIGQLKLKSGDGKEYLTDCADTEGIFRIIQSIPSKKAEPFKRWLAEVGSDRIKEIENPELVQKRAREYYEAKGYSKDCNYNKIFKVQVLNNTNLSPQYLACDMLGFSFSEGEVVYE